MKRTALSAAAVAIWLGLGNAQAEPEYIAFKPNSTKGALWAPQGTASPVAFLAIHRTSNFMNMLATKELSERGFTVLGMNPRSDNNEAAVDFELIALDIKQGVEFLKSRPGIEKVVLIGHSGGGPSTSFYQATAEAGIAYCSGENKLSKCDDGLKDLPKADGIVFLDAHPGNTINALRSLKPAVLDENDPSKIDPALDPFDPKNGFNPEGDSTYSAEFVERYTKAQAARMNRLIDKAQALAAAIEAGTAATTDDMPFIAYRDRARLSDISTAVHCCTERPQKLLKNDGTISTEIVKTVRQPQPNNAKGDKTLNSSLFLTVKSFLSANAIRANDSLDDIDVCSSNNSTLCAVGSIGAPTLVAAMGGHYFIRDGETIFDASVAKDKDFIVVEGAVHGMTPCKPCSEATGVDYGNATKNLYDYLAKWTDERFPRKP